MHGRLSLLLLGRGADASAIEHGRGDRSDPQFLSAKPFPANAKVRRIADGETLTLGEVALTAHATPGHTLGSTSWTWESCEQRHCVHIVYADSLSAITDDEYRYTDEGQHAGVVAAFEASIAKVAALPCDILLTPHPDASRMWERFGKSAADLLIDTDACKRHAQDARDNLEKRMAKERGAPAP